VLGKALT
jgi:dynein heavy chain